MQARPRIAAGSRHTCSIDSTGNVRCWGDNGAGQLGTGAAGGTSPTPVEIRFKTFTDVAVGSAHTCTLSHNGSARCWGRNAEGQLGTGDYVATDGPVSVSTFP